MAESAAGPAQRIAEYGQEHDRRNDTLEAEEVLHLGVGNAEERELKQKVEDKAAHARRGDALRLGYVVRNPCKAWPDGRQQDRHALAAGRGLDTEPDNGEDTAR